MPARPGTDLGRGGSPPFRQLDSRDLCLSRPEARAKVIKLAQQIAGLRRLRHDPPANPGSPGKESAGALCAHPAPNRASAVISINCAAIPEHLSESRTVRP